MNQIKNYTTTYQYETFYVVFSEFNPTQVSHKHTDESQKTQ